MTVEQETIVDTRTDDTKDDTKDETNDSNETAVSETEEATTPQVDVAALLARLEVLEQQVAKKPKVKKPAGSQAPTLPTANTVGNKATDLISREDMLLKQYSAWKKSQGIHI